uniref:Uncharacterized protein n=1 Tax=Chenopodium quinoa TaxID=63459 RepID=A0A803KNW4_CHEQI
MPKFFLKTLHRRKPSHRRSISGSSNIVGSKYLKDSGAKNGEIKVEKIKRTNKFFQKKDKLMQLIPPVKRITSMMSILFRNNTRRDQDYQCEDHEPRELDKQGSEKSSLKEVPSSAATSKKCKCGVGDVASLTVNRERTSTVKSVRNKGEKKVEAKGGLKIKRIIKVKIKERGKAEKRFELCKKKILMGEKCKPLHGSLQYDKNGVLVPEDFA